MTFTTALALFGLLTIATIGVEIMYTYATKGFGFGFSANRPTPEKTPIGLRIERVYRNQVESAAYAVPMLAGGAILGLTGAASIAALTLILGRLAFVLLYYTGIPFVRVPAFLVSSLSTLYICYAILTHTVM